jgi:hypothetical protein
MQGQSVARSAAAGRPEAKIDPLRTFSPCESGVEYIAKRGPIPPTPSKSSPVCRHDSESDITRNLSLLACSAMSSANKIAQASPENIDASLGSRFTRVPSIDTAAAATTEPFFEASVYRRL